MSRLGRQGYLRLDIKANHNKSESFKWGCLRVVSLKMSVSMDFSIFTRFAYPLNNGGMVFVLPVYESNQKDVRITFVATDYGVSVTNIME